MAAKLKDISDALVAALAAVPELGEGRAAAFDGSVREFVEQGGTAPFAGVGLEGLSYQTLSSDNALAQEKLDFRIVMLAQDFRGPGYSLEGGYGLLDPLLETLLGADLGLAGLAPIELLSMGRESEDAEYGLTVFNLRVSTWRVNSQA